MAEETNDIFKGLEGFLVNGVNQNSTQGFIGDPTMKDNTLIDVSDPTKTSDNPAEIEPKGLTIDEIESATALDSEEINKPEEDTNGVETFVDEEKVGIYKSLSQQLIDDGIVESEFSNPEEMINSFKSIIDNNINDWVDSLPEQLKELVTNYKEGVPFDELLKIKSDEIRLDAITDEVLEDSEAKQKDVYKQYLKATTKFSDARIEKELTKAEDLGELLDNAKESLAELRDIKKAELAEAKIRENENRILAENQRIETLNEVNKVIKATKEIIPGVKLTEKEQGELYKMITTPVETRGNQQYTAAMVAREKDPIAFELKLNYFIKKGFFEEGAKFDSIIKKVETKNLSALEKQIEAMSKRNFNKAGNPAPEIKNDTLAALKAQFNK